ncbi:MAG: isoprenylcysteine carboxylmethyltransferase family protein [Methanomassiliicoccus sp.]|nr:isoprenylcysteine carboxylmethyltransferase family protein [Methanomassiliicoccus sp.]
MAGARVRYERPTFTMLLFVLIFFGLIVTVLDPTGIAADGHVAITDRSLTAVEQALLITGASMVLSGIVIRVIAIVTLGKNFSGRLRIREDHTLVRTGIYRYVRHPAYLGAILLFLGIPVMVSSILGFLAMFLLVIYLLYRIRLEERMLITRFGEEYLEYMRHSKRLIPFIY